jgi:hypothetical protein
MSRSQAAWLAVLGVAVGACLGISAGPRALLYGLTYVLAVSPGVALGTAIFGRRHGAGWIAGALVGYGTTQLALWAALAVGAITGWAFVAAWALQAVALAAITSGVTAPLVVLPAWDARDTRALALTLLLVPVLMAPPYRKLGYVDDSGTQHYRAYFTADFVWHTALAAEIGKHNMPPRNPYLAHVPIHYYWTYFLLPAIVAHDGPQPLRDVQATLEANAICSAALTLAALFLLVRRAVTVGSSAAIATVLGVVAGSAEGAWTLWRLLDAHAPLAAVKDLNIDAMTAWRLQGPRIDALPRSLWYNPQHSIACALGLIALLVACSDVGIGGALFAGTALALATTMNPFVGGMFSLLYGCAVLWSAVRDGAAVRIIRHAVAIMPVAVAIWWIVANQITSGAGASFAIGPHGTSHSPVLTLLLNAGPVLVPGVIGLLIGRGLPAGPRRIALTGVPLTIALIYLLTLGDADWVGFRAGQILYLLLPIGIARLLWVMAQRPRHRLAIVAIVIAVLGAGLPTTVIDEYNAQDIWNLDDGAGFRWTVTLTAAEREALDWVRMQTPESALVQAEPIVRGRDEWSLIPTFAQRRMAAGLPISLQPTPEYRARSEQVRAMFMTRDAAEAWRIAVHLHLSYIFTDLTDIAAYGEGARKFGSADRYFETVFRNSAAAVYRVR